MLLLSVLFVPILALLAWVLFAAFIRIRKPAMETETVPATRTPVL